MTTVEIIKVMGFMKLTNAEFHSFHQDVMTVGASFASAVKSSVDEKTFTLLFFSIGEVACIA